MNDNPEEFFKGLADHFEPLLSDASGILHVELADNGHKRNWYLKIDGGKVTVSRKAAAADCMIQSSRKLFEAVLRGDTNLIAQAMRGAITVAGDAVIAMQFQRLLGGPGPTSDIPTNQ